MPAVHRDHVRRRVPLRDVSYEHQPSEPLVDERLRPIPNGREPLLRQRVDDAVATVERATTLLATLRRDISIAQQEAEVLRREIQAAEAEQRQSQDRVAELERALATERKRAAEAEHRATHNSAEIEDLEQRIQSIQLETEDLVEAATRLLSRQPDAHRPRAVAGRPRGAA